MTRSWDSAHLGYKKTYIKNQSKRLGWVKTGLLFGVLATSSGWAKKSHFKNKQRGDNCESTLAAIRNDFANSTPKQERSAASIDTLKFGTYNIYGVFKNTYAQSAKSPEQVREMFRIINEEDPDVLFMQEVESLAALERANKELLGDRYRVILNPGSDPIHVAVLIKKDLPFDYTVASEGNRRSVETLSDGEKLFTRDFPVIRLFPKGMSQPGAAPLMVLMGHHYKSKRDRPGDPQSRKVAAAQFGATRSIVAELLEKYCAELPVFLAADFNRDVRTDAEPQILMDLMKDTLNLAKETVAPESRVTQTFHPPQGGVVNNQLDAILATAAMNNLIMSGHIPRYRNPDGTEKPLPETFSQRSRNPSDHFPVFIQLDFKSMQKHYEETKDTCVDKKLFPKNAA
jgi:endonuclease/exonuclease/phosphatase family metal-dependent hydrolase